MGVKLPEVDVSGIILSIYLFIKAILPILQTITCLTIIIFLPLINNKIKNRD